MKDDDLMYFAFAFIVGMFIHYNMKETCKGRGFLLEGATTKPPAKCKKDEKVCKPSGWFMDGYCESDKMPWYKGCLWYS